MFDKCPVFAVIGILVVSPALADVVDVSVNGSINATDDVGYVCGIALPCGGQVTVSNSFTLIGTNTALGSFTKSGSTSATDRMFGFTDSLSVSANQTATLTSFPGMIDYLQLAITNLETPGGVLGGSANSRNSFWDASITNDISVTFTLTSESLAFLTTLNDVSSPFSSMLLDSAGNTIFVFPTTGGSPQTLVLGVGTYQLVDDFTGGASGFAFTNNSPMSQNDEISARFEPIPEPRWTAFPPLAAALLLLLWIKYRRSLQLPARPRSWAMVSSLDGDFSGGSTKI